MSADYQRECPACPARLQAEIKAIQAQLDDAYGKVSHEEYRQLQAQLGRAKAALKYKKRAGSLSEYYEIYYNEDKNVYVVDFEAICEACGFSTSFTHEHKVELP